MKPKHWILIILLVVVAALGIWFYFQDAKKSELKGWIADGRNAGNTISETDESRTIEQGMKNLSLFEIKELRAIYKVPERSRTPAQVNRVMEIMQKLGR